MHISILYIGSRTERMNERTNEQTKKNKEHFSDAHQSRNNHWDFDVSTRNIQGDHATARDIRNSNHNAMTC